MLSSARVEAAKQAMIAYPSTQSPEASRLDGNVQVRHFQHSTLKQFSIESFH